MIQTQKGRIYSYEKADLANKRKYHHFRRFIAVNKLY